MDTDKSLAGEASPGHIVFPCSYGKSSWQRRKRRAVDDMGLGTNASLSNCAADLGPCDDSVLWVSAPLWKDSSHKIHFRGLL